MARVVSGVTGLGLFITTGLVIGRADAILAFLIGLGVSIAVGVVAALLAWPVLYLYARHARARRRRGW